MEVGEESLSGREIPCDFHPNLCGKRLNETFSKRETWYSHPGIPGLPSHCLVKCIKKSVLFLASPFNLH